MGKTICGIMDDFYLAINQSPIEEAVHNLLRAAGGVSNLEAIEALARLCVALNAKAKRDAKRD